MTSNDQESFLLPEVYIRPRIDQIWQFFSKMTMDDPPKCNLLTLSGHFNLFFQITLIIIFVMLFVSLKWYIQF